MPNTISGMYIEFKARGDMSKSSPLGASYSLPQEITNKLSFAFGTAVNQVNLMYAERLTITATNSGTIDLFSALTDIFGDTITISEVIALVVHNRSNVADSSLDADCTITGTFVIGTLIAGTPTGVPLQSRGCLISCSPQAGITIVDGTGDSVIVTNNESGGGNTASVDVFIFARTA